MNFLKQLANMFSGGPRTGGGDPGLYYYVKCNRCGEVIRVRINPMNDLSQSDDGSNWYARKVIVGQRCYNRIEGTFTYNSGRRLINSELSGGEMVSKKEYDAFKQENPEGKEKETT